MAHAARTWLTKRWTWSDRVLACPDSALADEKTWFAAVPVASDAWLTPTMFADTSCAAWAVCWMLRLMSAVALFCWFTALAMLLLWWREQR